jgi:hypothetical protein
MEAMAQTTKPDATRSDNGLDLTLRLTLRDPIVRDPCLANPRKPKPINKIACPFFCIISQILSNPLIDRPICAHFGRRRADGNWRARGYPFF